MNTAPLISPEIFDYLRRLGIEPYTKLNDMAREQLGDGVRLIALGAGESFATPREGLRVTILSGTVRLGAGDVRLDLNNTRDHAVTTRSGDNMLRAEDDAIVLLADSEFLDTLSSWGELAAYAQQSGGDVLVERLLAVKHSLAFRRLPLEHVVEALQQMQPRPARAGEVVVAQGQRGDAFYLIWRGRAEVWKTGLYDDEAQLVDTLAAGDAFGDEALVTGGTRSATVKMVEDGELLVLGEQAFRDCISRPLIGEVPPGAVPQLLREDWKIVDVRYEEEFEDGHIPEAILLPLPSLRQLADRTLDRTGKYIAVCRSGKRSAVAAFLLKQRGYEVVSMKAGMTGWEGEVVV